ncbi:unnamed protein product, partial [Meganyctiphanes norvegica]
KCSASDHAIRFTNGYKSITEGRVGNAEACLTTGESKFKWMKKTLGIQCPSPSEKIFSIHHDKYKEAVTECLKVHKAEDKSPVTVEPSTLETCSATKLGATLPRTLTWPDSGSYTKCSDDFLTVLPDNAYKLKEIRTDPPNVPRKIPGQVV